MKKPDKATTIQIVICIVIILMLIVYAKILINFFDSLLLVKVEW